jgi:hypothetical protein
LPPYCCPFYWPVNSFPSDYSRAPFWPILINGIMIIWHKTDFGYHFTFSGTITLEETIEWIDQAKESVLQLEGKDFCVFVDMREIEILPAECKAKVEEIQKFYKKHGMNRSVIILSDEVTLMQLKLIAKKTGIYQSERYINGSSNPDGEEIAMDWILHAVDPEAKVVISDKS